MDKPRYDFETLPGRSLFGSAKCGDMRGRNPAVPPGIVPFSVADMELRTAPEIVEGLKEFIDSDVLGYAAPRGDYYEAVAGWMRRRHDWEVDPETIVGYPGIVPALFAAVNAFTAPGDGVVVMPPVYYPFFAAINTTGRRIVEAPLVESGGMYRMDMDLFRERAAEKDVTLIILCSPHNPVGRVWAEEELRELGRIAMENGVIVASDEIHFDIVGPGHTHRVFARLGQDYADNCIVCTAPSKTFNLAGLQASNIIIPNRKLLDRFLVAKHSAGLRALGILAYRAAQLAYERAEPWLDALLVHIAENGRLVRAFIACHFPEVRVFPLEGTYLLWLDFRAWGMDAKELETFMTRKALLFFDEGHVFGTGGAGFERINLACPSRILMEGLERLRAAKMS
ncbi:MAG: pyridoxal phosphate-dependent aminotransferase [Planctomycetota bacterium]|jgi:putative C-S lyase|nr:pyridoxal phosphate-dependent aminotransferase [Planctomycetota bacterium]